MRCLLAGICCITLLESNFASAQDFTHDWPMWGGTGQRHNVATARQTPLDWDIGDFGEIAIANPNTALIWKYTQHDIDRDGKIEFFEQMHRSIATPLIKDNLLFVSDFSGLVHCLDVKTGRPHWSCDLLGAVWSSPLLVNDHVYIGDEDGDIAILRASADPKLSLDLADEKEDGKVYGTPLREINMRNSTYTLPVMANGVLYITNRTHLFAIDVGKGE